MTIFFKTVCNIYQILLFVKTYFGPVAEHVTAFTPAIIP